MDNKAPLIFGNKWQCLALSGILGMLRIAVFVDTMTEPSGHMTDIGLVESSTFKSKCSVEIGK